MVFRPRFDEIGFGEDPEIEKQIQERIAKQRAAVAAGNDRPEPDEDEQAYIDAQNEARRKSDEEARKAAEEEARRKAAEEEARRKAAEEEARRKAEEEQQQQQTSGYPKTLYNERGEDITVNSQAAENQARQRGFTLSSPPTSPDTQGTVTQGGYPKTLFNADGSYRIVFTKDQEDSARSQGFTLDSSPTTGPTGGGVKTPPPGGQGSYAGYPKVLYNPTTGESTTVTDPQGERAARQSGYTSPTPPPAPAPITLYKTLFKRDPDGTLQTISIPYLQGQDDTWQAYLNQNWFEEDPGVAEAPFEPVEYNQGGTWYKISGYPGVTGDTYAIEYELTSGRKIYYLASKSELDSIFGDGAKPSQVTNVNWADFKSNNERFFGGAAAEIIGTNDNFATRVTRVIESGGTNDLPLPDFVKNNQDLLDIFFLAVAEGKSQTWLLKEMSKVQAFKDEFPGIDTIYAQTQDWEEAVNTWNQFSSEVVKLNTRYGETVDVSDLVSAAVEKGYTIQDIQKTYEIFENAERNSDFLTAFQEIINADSDVQFDVTTPEGIVDFFEGKAPTEIYDLYEASSIQQQATRFDLGVDAEGAIQLALQTPGQITPQNIAQSLQQAAIQIARFREDIDMGRYGLTEQVLINSALGVKTPGISDIEIQDIFSRIFQENQALQNKQEFIFNEQASPFRGRRDIRSV